MRLNQDRLRDIEDRLRRIAQKLTQTSEHDPDAYLLLGDANYLTDVRLYHRDFDKDKP
jgi:hypothetical protein